MGSIRICERAVSFVKYLVGREWRIRENGQMYDDIKRYCLQCHAGIVCEKMDVISLLKNELLGLLNNVVYCRITVLTTE